MSEHLKASELAAITGFSSRYFQRLAAEKQIDWAFQPGGQQTGWRFDRRGFERWWNGGKKKWRKPTSAVKRGGAGSRTAVKNTGDLLKQRLQELRMSGC